MTEPTSGGGSAMSTDTARQLAGAAVVAAMAAFRRETGADLPAVVAGEMLAAAAPLIEERVLLGEADVLERVAVNTRPDVVRAGNVDWMLGFEAGVGEAVTALRRRAAKRTVGGGQR